MLKSLLRVMENKIAIILKIITVIIALEPVIYIIRFGIFSTISFIIIIRIRQIASNFPIFSVFID